MGSDSQAQAASAAGQPGGQEAESVTSTGDASRFNPRSIGIYGPRAAGKTCYLATALLGMSTCSNCTILLAEEATRGLLLDYWKALKEGELPPATEMALKPLAGSIVISTPLPMEQPLTETAEGQADPPAAAASAADQKTRVPFRTHDFGGQLAERSENGQPQLTAEFYQWLEEADCLLFFLAVDQLQDPREAQERLLEVDALLSRLVEKSPTGHAISQPIAVLITKWDLASDLSGSPDEEHQKVIDFLKNRGGQLGQSICEKIKTVGEQVAIFPVSTFGGHEDGKPICPLRPFNLHEPLVWALQRTNRCLFKKAERQAEDALRNPVWKGYSRAIRAYEELIDAYGINRGPVYDEAQTQLASLRAARRRRIFGLVLLCLMLLLFPLGYGSYRLDQSKYIDLLARLDAPRDPYPVLETEVARYRKGWNPWARVLGHASQVARCWEVYLDGLKRGFGEVEKLRNSVPPPDLEARIDHYRRLLAACQDFLRKYLQSPYQNQVARWLEETQHELDGLEFVQKVETLVAQWHQEPEAPKEPDRVRELLSQAEQLTGQKPDPPHAREVTQAIAKLDAFVRDLKAYLGDVHAQCERYAAQVNDWANRVENSLAEEPADLTKLHDLQQEGETLRNQSPPDSANSQAIEAKQNFAGDRSEAEF